jgi:hypothetical protein
LNPLVKLTFDKENIMKKSEDYFNKFDIVLMTAGKLSEYVKFNILTSIDKN